MHFKPGRAVKCQPVTSLPFPTKCIWRVGTQDRSRNSDQEGELFRLTSTPLNTTKIGDTLNPAKCRFVISCVWWCAETANCSEESSAVPDWIVLEVNRKLQEEEPSSQYVAFDLCSFHNARMYAKQQNCNFVYLNIGDFRQKTGRQPDFNAKIRTRNAVDVEDNFRFHHVIYFGENEQLGQY